MCAGSAFLKELWLVWRGYVSLALGSRLRPCVDRMIWYPMTNVSSAPTSRRRMIAYWVTTALVVFELVSGGVWDILRVPQVRVLIEHLGYPSYFIVILGIWKLLGAAALVIPKFPRLKEWAYAGVIFDLTGAVASLFASGLVTVGTTAYPMFMVGVAFASWALRPPSRRLA